MNAGRRNLILVLVLIAALLVIIVPRLLAPEPEEFAPTEDPGRVLEESLAEGKSVFLEFYSET